MLGYVWIPTFMALWLLSSAPHTVYWDPLFLPNRLQLLVKSIKTHHFLWICAVSDQPDVQQTWEPEYGFRCSSITSFCKQGKKKQKTRGMFMSHHGVINTLKPHSAEVSMDTWVEILTQLIYQHSGVAKILRWDNNTGVQTVVVQVTVETNFQVSRGVRVSKPASWFNTDLLYLP